jgi:DNA-directed RNA polymerase subunit RPC12/RpoP
MTTNRIPLDLAGALADPDRCPECGSEDLVQAVDGERTSYLCQTCHRCWHWELGWMSLVDPRDCHECGFRVLCLDSLPAEGRSVGSEGRR